MGSNLEIVVTQGLEPLFNSMPLFSASILIIDPLYRAPGSLTTNVELSEGINGLADLENGDKTDPVNPYFV